MSDRPGEDASSQEPDPAASDATEPSGPQTPHQAQEGPEAEEFTAVVESGSGDVEEMPPVPEHIREAARQAPDHWFAMVDPTWSGGGTPPDWALVGQWRSDVDGEIVEWRDNEEYRPSPTALEWPDPTDSVDAAVQLAATGYGPAEAVARALTTAEVAVFLAPGGGPLSAVAPDDATPVVPVFTAPDHLHAAGRLSFRTMKAAELLDQLPEGHLIYVNPSGPVGMTVEPHMLRETMTAAEAEGESTWVGDLDDILPPRPDEPAQPTAGGTADGVPASGGG
ncbi:type VII secretion system-associated protein [Streptomyces sp. NPDC048434]|uniref:type VII secretion system-associated protein n=1 Tax=Streptomyces sp. NPDC048434 TaxID=3365549 RepID=UPI003715F6DC